MLARRFLVALAVFALSASPACAQGIGYELRLPDERMLGRFGLHMLWWSQATVDPGQSIVRHVSVDEEMLLVHSSTGALTAFDAESGKKYWSVQIGSPNAPSFPPVTNNDYVLATAGKKVFAVDKFDGHIQWVLDLPKQPSTGVSTDDEQLYVGTLEGSVFAFDLRKVLHHSSEGLLPQFTMDTLNWRYRAAKTITSPPLSFRQTVYFASRDKSLYALNRLERTLRWQLESDAAVTAPLAQSRDGAIVLASEDENVYCVNSNGRVRWEFVAGYPIFRAPRVIENEVYLFPENGGVYCLSMASGRELWHRPHIVDFIGATRYRVFVRDIYGNVVMLSRADGTVVGVMPLRHFNVPFGNVRTDRIYLVTLRGLVVGMRERDAEFPRYHLYPERQPLVPEFAEPTDGEQNAGN